MISVFLGEKSYVYLYNLGLSEHHYSLTLDLSVNKKVVFLSNTAGLFCNSVLVYTAGLLILSVLTFMTVFDGWDMGNIRRYLSLFDRKKKQLALYYIYTITGMLLDEIFMDQEIEILKLKKSS